MVKRNILVTAALPYANGPIHLGHLVEYTQADIWVRFQRLRGNTCLFICGDDAHGTPIMLSASKQNITPEELVANIHAEHLRDFTAFFIISIISTRLIRLKTANCLNLFTNN